MAQSNEVDEQWRGQGGKGAAATAKQKQQPHQQKQQHQQEAQEEMKQQNADLVVKGLQVPLLQHMSTTNSSDSDSPSLTPIARNSDHLTTIDSYQSSWCQSNGGGTGHRRMNTDGSMSQDLSTDDLGSSDFTVPTSNLGEGGLMTPPPDMRRKVFGNRVQVKYQHGGYGVGTHYGENNEYQGVDVDRGLEVDDGLMWGTSLLEQHRQIRESVPETKNDEGDSSDIFSPMSPLHLGQTVKVGGVSSLPVMSPITPHNGKDFIPKSPPISPSHHSKRHKQKPHETIHAQSLLLGCLFMLIWSPSNLMAPNLTQMADFFHMTESQRDLYLGSYIALATGVLSFPISASIGILTDNYSRKILFVSCGVGGALSSYATGLAPNYQCLFIARLLNGGFMSASVPVAFSLLGDLFATEERNAASSGLTAMMGVGIVLGQVYAGAVGSSKGWEHPFHASSIVTILFSLFVCLLIQEPIRGGKEKVLQDMIKQGTRYERKLTWNGFVHAMQNNRSNRILMYQGFFSSLPWGIIFVFLNDFLSQERGFSVPDATYIVLVFGIGCAFGGVFGGYWGSIFQTWDRSYLPLFMAATTFLGFFPFLGLLNGVATNAHGLWVVLWSWLGGFIASLPSVNVRPCLINVNPPETRGASLTAANLIINLARGIGPSCITLMVSIWHVDRKFAFNVTLILFWCISAIQLLYLAKSLPVDQDAMEAELADYAASALAKLRHAQDDETIISIEDRMVSFDQKAARESLSFVQKGIKEMRLTPCGCAPDIEGSDYSSSNGSETDSEKLSSEDLLQRRELWVQHQQQNALTQDEGEDTEVQRLLAASNTYGSNETITTRPDENFNPSGETHLLV